MLQTCQVKGYFSKQLLPRRRNKAAKRHSVWPCAIESGQYAAEKSCQQLIVGNPCWSLEHHPSENLYQTDNLLSNLWPYRRCITPDKTQSMCCVCKKMYPPAIPLIHKPELEHKRKYLCFCTWWLSHDFLLDSLLWSCITPGWGSSPATLDWPACGASRRVWYLSACYLCL